LLKSFTREILRAQPDSIYEFGAQYFSQLIEEQKTGGKATGEGPSTSGAAISSVQQAAAELDLSSLTPSELEPIILRLFIEADLDGSGYLDRHEFANVLRSANLNLNERHVRQILAEADENEDDVIQYKEFLPVMVDILQGIKAKEQARSMMSKVEDLVRNEVEDMLLHGLTKPELEALMLRVFRKADADKSGMLSRREFKDCLMAAELGLTRKDINLLLFSVDVNGDGMVSYNEFIPVCFQVLVERFKDEIVVSDILTNQDGLQGMLLRSFQEVDQDGTGLLAPAMVKQVLKDLSFQMLGLTTLQLVTLVSQAPTDSRGLVQYVQFVPIAASMIYAMYDVDSMKLRLQAIKEVSAAGGMAQLISMDIGALRGLLEEQFKAADVEGTGQLTMPEVMQVLNNLGTLAPDSVPLSDTHMRAMFTAIDADENGTVDWFELVSFICDAIEHLEREQYLASLSQQAE